MTPSRGSEPVEITDPVDMNMGGEIEKVLIHEESLRSRVRELGEEISLDYENQSPIVVGVLKGSFVFLADLIRTIHIPITMDFMTVESYSSASSTGNVVVTHDIGIDVTGRHVLLVEDIVDTGLTLSRLTDILSARNPATLELCALLQKRNDSCTCRELKYIGFRIPDVYVVGYGLDYDGNYRNLPFVGILRGLSI
ncbi:MAG: hypoxanthine phosphoribosyltransferase [Candidatus Glassbacteria bacterium]